MRLYGDIVRVDVVDTYGDLSLKTLKLFATLPSKIDADFYFKVDDDVAVNVDAMATYLRERRSQGNLYLVSHRPCCGDESSGLAGLGHLCTIVHIFQNL